MLQETNIYFLVLILQNLFFSNDLKGCEQGGCRPKLWRKMLLFYDQIDEDKYINGQAPFLLTTMAVVSILAACIQLGCDDVRIAWPQN